MFSRKFTSKKLMIKRAVILAVKAVGEAVIAVRRILENGNPHPAGAEAQIVAAAVVVPEEAEAIRVEKEETVLRRITAIIEINATKTIVMKERQGRQNTLLQEHRSTISTDFKIE